MKVREFEALPVPRDVRVGFHPQADEPCEREVDLQALLHRLPIPIVVHALDGAVRYANSAASEFFGLPLSRLYRRSATDAG